VRPPRGSAAASNALARGCWGGEGERTWGPSPMWRSLIPGNRVSKRILPLGVARRDTEGLPIGGAGNRTPAPRPSSASPERVGQAAPRGSVHPPRIDGRPVARPDPPAGTMLVLPKHTAISSPSHDRQGSAPRTGPLSSSAVLG